MLSESLVLQEENADEAICFGITAQEIDAMYHEWMLISFRG